MARLDEVKRLQKIAGILKENINEAPIGTSDSATLDAIIKANYPTARKVDDNVFKNISDLWNVDGAELLGYYITHDLEGADEDGTIDVENYDHDDFTDTVAVRVMKEPSGEIEVYELNKWGEPDPRDGAGTIENGKIKFYYQR